MNPINSKSIRNIIFDLGGVILNLNYHNTEEAFINLGISNFNELFTQYHANNFFMDFEKGKITPAIFIQELKNYAPGLSEEDIITAWNAMLLDFPPGRMAFLLKLKNRYRTFVLSNTNAIHHQAFQKIDLNAPGALENFFEKVYYSHELGYRKPDVEIFEHVLRENNLQAAETLFIDDSQANVEGARLANIKAIYLAPLEKIEDILADF